MRSTLESERDEASARSEKALERRVYLVGTLAVREEEHRLHRRDPSRQLVLLKELLVRLERGELNELMQRHYPHVVFHRDGGFAALAGVACHFTAAHATCANPIVDGFSEKRTPMQATVASRT